MSHDIDTVLQQAQPTQSVAERDAMFASIMNNVVAPTETSIVPSPYVVFWSERVPMMLVVVLCFCLTAGGTVAAAESARPGDLLFPLDRATEELRLMIAAADEKVVLQAAFLDERLAELDAVIREETNRVQSHSESEISSSVSVDGEERILRALETFLEQANAVSDEAAADRLRVALSLVDGIDRDGDSSRLRTKFDNERFEIRTDDGRVRGKDDGREVEIRAYDDDNNDDRDDDNHNEDRRGHDEDATADSSARLYDDNRDDRDDRRGSDDGYDDRRDSDDNRDVSGSASDRDADKEDDKREHDDDTRSESGDRDDSDDDDKDDKDDKEDDDKSDDGDGDDRQVATIFRAYQLTPESI